MAADFVNARIPHPLRDRIDAVRPATVSRNRWVLDAIEMRLQDTTNPHVKPTARFVADLSERPAAPKPRGALPPPPFVAEENRCHPCKRHGPPRSGRPCSSCGHSRDAQPER